MRRLALAVAALALTGCSAASAADPAATAARAARTAPAPLECAWYTPTIVGQEADGQEVVITMTGPACGSLTLIRWVSLKTQGSPWARTTRIEGTIIAQVAKGGTVVKIYQSGFALATDETAGDLADAFLAAGWSIEQPVAQRSL
jgi:hypothetical protein